MSRPSVASLMKLYALPISRAPALAPLSRLPNPQLAYYYVYMKKRAQDEGAKPTLSNRAMQKAAEIWTSWGKAEGGWKLKVHRWGEQVYERIEFEESALKTVDPAVLPRLNETSDSHVTAAEIKKAIESGERLAIPLYYAPSALPNPLEHFQGLISKRAPLHRKWMWIWLLISPVTAPVAILPIIPNIPFFFCLWRAYNHWRAQRGANFLQELLDNDCIVAKPHSPLESFYSRSRISSATTTTSKESSTRISLDNLEPDALLVTRDTIPAVIEALEQSPANDDNTPLPGDAELKKLSGLGPELARAVDQAIQRIAKLEGKEKTQ